MIAAISTQLLITVAFMDTMAQLPLLAPFAASLGADGVMVGAILGSYSLVNMIGNVAAGPVIDRVGRRAGVVTGMLVAGAAVGAYSLVTSPSGLLALRLVHGAGGAVLIPAVFALAGDRALYGSVGRSMGYAGAAVAVAAMVGPALGGIGRVAIGVRPVFALLGALLVGTGLAVLAFAREPRRSAARPPAASRPSLADAVCRAVGDRHLRSAYLSVFTLTFAMGTLAFAFPLTMEASGFSAARTGSFFSLFAVAAILVLVLPTNRLSDRYGRQPLVLAGSVAVAAALVGLAAAPGQSVIWLLMVVYGIGYGTLFPSVCAIVVERTTPDNRGAAFGVFYAAFSLGTTVGPVAAGFISRTPVSPYWAAVGVIVAARVWAAARAVRSRPDDKRRGGR